MCSNMVDLFVFSHLQNLNIILLMNDFMIHKADKHQGLVKKRNHLFKILLCTADLCLFLFSHRQQSCFLMTWLILSISALRVGVAQCE